jgi:hypothetical protein
MFSQLAAVLLVPATTVGYNPVEMTGFVAASDVRQAFGWTAADLTAHAGGVVFNHEFWTDDNYTVSCGGPSFPVVHHRVYGRFELTGQFVSDGYERGFRLTGAHAGISGTSVAPAPGQPCPEPGRGPSIARAAKTTTVTCWSLTATSEDVRKEIEAPVC